MKTKQLLTMLYVAFILVSCSENETSDELDTTQFEVNQSDITEQAYFDKKGLVSEGYFNGSKISYETIDGEHVLEGDIIIDKNSIFDTAQKSVGRTRRKWPNKTVYYRIASNLPNKSRVRDAIKHWERKTDIKFVRRDNQRNYVRFIKGSGCSSSVGMVGGKQNIKLSSRCSTGNTIHEIGHALGLWHEQSRVDRNKYIKIHFDNIKSGKSHNFKTYKDRGRDGDEYTNDLDFGSIMMYSSKAFSKNGKATITRLDGKSYKAQRKSLSSGDLRGIREMY